MKIKESKIYKKIFLATDDDAVTGKQMEYFVFCGDKNWDHFFDKVVENKKGFEVIKNVKLIEFFTQKDLGKYLDKLPDVKMLNFSYDEDFIAVLELVN